ncbi:MAG: OmpA family protein [Myxococcota bacterium]
MGRRAKCDECKPGLPAWMGTYSDLVTLMMAFFVMLVAMANFEDTKRIEAVVESIHTALGMRGFDSKMVAVSKKLQFTESVRRDQTVEPVVAKLRQAMAKHMSDDFVRMVEQKKELRIKLNGRVFFQPGSALLHPSSYAILADLGSALKDEKVLLRVEGYADESGNEEANWSLSGQRALAVVLALREKGPIKGKYLEAVAHGSFHPGAKEPESSDWARRVDIVLSTDDLAGARAAGRFME